MDRSTLAAYDKDAAAFAKEWHEQPAPVDLQEIVGASSSRAAQPPISAAAAAARWRG